MPCSCCDCSSRSYSRPSFGFPYRRVPVYRTVIVPQVYQVLVPTVQLVPVRQPTPHPRVTPQTQPDFLSILEALLLQENESDCGCPRGVRPSQDRCTPRVTRCPVQSEERCTPLTCRPVQVENCCASNVTRCDSQTEECSLPQVRRAPQPWRPEPRSLIEEFTPLVNQARETLGSLVSNCLAEGTLEVTVNGETKTYNLKDLLSGSTVKETVQDVIDQFVDQVDSVEDSDDSSSDSETEEAEEAEEAEEKVDVDLVKAKEVLQQVQSVLNQMKVRPPEAENLVSKFSAFINDWESGKINPDNISEKFYDDLIAEGQVAASDLVTCLLTALCGAGEDTKPVKVEQSTSETETSKTQQSSSIEEKSSKVEETPCDVKVIDLTPLATNLLSKGVNIFKAVNNLSPPSEDKIVEFFTKLATPGQSAEGIQELIKNVLETEEVKTDESVKSDEVKDHTNCFVSGNFGCSCQKVPEEEPLKKQTSVCSPRDDLAQMFGFKLNDGDKLWSDFQTNIDSDKVRSAVENLSNGNVNGGLVDLINAFSAPAESDTKQ